MNEDLRQSIADLIAEELPLLANDLAAASEALRNKPLDAHAAEAISARVRGVSEDIALASASAKLLREAAK
jgi:hypothetical protein